MDNTVELIRQSDRLLALGVEAPGYSSTRAAFVDHLWKALGDMEWALFRQLPLQGLVDWGLTEDVRCLEQASPPSKTRVAPRVDGPGAVNEADLQKRAVIGFPFKVLASVLQEREDIARALTFWMGECVAETDTVLATPGATSDADVLRRSAERLKSDLVGRFEALKGVETRLRLATLARQFLNEQDSVSFLFNESVPAVKGAQSLSELTSQLLASLVVHPACYLTDLEALFEHAEGREFLSQALSAKSRLAATAAQLDADLEVRTRYAQCLLAHIRGIEAAGMADEGWRLAAAAAPRNYSSSSNYRALQEARASVYDDLARLTYGDVDVEGFKSVSGRIGLLVSTLEPSAESQAIMAHRDALISIGYTPVLIVWPHSKGQARPMNGSVGGAPILDLSDLPFPQRVKAVRALQLDCLLFMNNLTWGWSEYIAASAFRLARVQVVTYLSVVTAGFANHDFFLVGRASEKGAPQERYLEQLCQMDGSVLCFPAQEVEAVGKGLQAGQRPVIACGASLPKLTRETLGLVFALAGQLNAERVIFYPFNPAWGLDPSHDATLVSLQRIAVEEGFGADQVNVSGPWETKDEVLDALRQCDVYIDSYPHSGGLSVLDAAMLGLPIVYRSGDQQRSLQAKNVTDALGARSIDVAHVPARTFDMNALFGEPAQVPQVSVLTDISGFGVRLGAALESIGTALQDEDVRWIDGIVFDTLTVSHYGVVRKLTSKTQGQDGPTKAIWIENQPFMALDNPTLNEVTLGSAKAFSTCRETKVVALPVTHCAGGVQMVLRVNGKLIGCSPPLGELPGVEQQVIFVALFQSGWNLVEYECKSASPHDQLTVGQPLILGRALVDDQFTTLRWTALEGFSFWEMPRPALGLMNAFRWCVGRHSVIEIEVDEACASINIDVHVANSRQVLTVLHDNAVVQTTADFAGGLDVTHTLTVEKAFAPGRHVLEVEANVVDKGHNRELSFILSNVRRHVKS